MSRKSSTRKTQPRIDFVREETNLFEEPGYDITIQNSSVSEYYPVNNISDTTAPITFFIQGNDTQYLDFAESKLYLQCKVTDADGGDLPKVDNAAVLSYAPVNNLLHTMFDKITFSLNETEVSPKCSYYPYRSYIEDTLAYSKEFKKTQAEVALFYRTASELNTTDAGWINRKNIVDGSKRFEMAGRPHGELFTQTRFMLPGVDVRIVFHRSTDKFCLQCVGTAPKEIKLEILECKLIVQKHTLLPSIQVAHLRSLEAGNPVVYANKEIVMKSYALPVGTLQNTNENLISGHLPDRIVLALVNSTNLHGTYATNPFAFEHFNLSHISLNVNGDQITTQGTEVDLTGPRVALSYLSIFDGLGVSNCDQGVDLKISEYTQGKILHVFNLRHAREAFCPPKFGNVAINLRFRAALPSTITVICYAEYQSVMYINQNRQVYFKDFSKEI